MKRGPHVLAMRAVVDPPLEAIALEHRTTLDKLKGHNVRTKHKPTRALCFRYLYREHRWAYATIAHYFECSLTTVKYWVDDAFKARLLWHAKRQSQQRSLERDAD